MFHSKTLQHHKDSALKSLHGEGNCRVVVSTTALGKGINVPNVSHVVIYSSPEILEAILQQIGKTGRDEVQSHAILFGVRHLREVVTKSLKNYFQQALYSQFEQTTDCVTPGNLCVTFCHSQCSCKGNSCSEHIPIYEPFRDQSAER